MPVWGGKARKKIGGARNQLSALDTTLMAIWTFLAKNPYYGAMLVMPFLIISETPLQQQAFRSTVVGRRWHICNLLLLPNSSRRNCIFRYKTQNCIASIDCCLSKECVFPQKEEQAQGHYIGVKGRGSQPSITEHSPLAVPPPNG
jgi:hypothetical protein